MRRHLAYAHTGAWILGCDQLQIKITASEVREVVRQYREDQGQDWDTILTRDSELPRTQFTKEHFVDGLVRWISGDDQVRPTKSHHTLPC